MTEESGDNPLVIQSTNRDTGWNKRLIYLVEEELMKPFSWDEANCSDLMAASVLACHGDKHPLLGELTHGSVDEVKASIASRGGIDNILSGYLQCIPRLSGQDGDIATFGKETLARAGLVLLDGVAVGKGEDGRTFRIPISVVENVYRV